MNEMNERFINNYSKLSSEFFSKMCKENEDPNTVCSSFSLYVLLGILANATDGETRREILNVLGYGDIVTLNEDIKAITETLCEDNEAKFISTNGICVKNDLVEQINKEFESSTKQMLNIEIFSGDNILKLINDWVNKNTNGMIPSILDEIPPRFVMILMNAIAFEAEWKEPYEMDDISKDIFHNFDKTETEVNMLYSFENLYIEDDNYTGFVKEYKGHKYAFMALLPKKKSKALFNKNLKTIDLSKLYSERTKSFASVYMPEFEVETGVELTKMCKELGVSQIFTDDADFSAIIKDVPTKLSSINQKAKIKVDRKGTKAAVVSHAAAIAGGAFFDEVKYIKLDRSFVYAVIHKESGLPVFSGVVNKL